MNITIILTFDGGRLVFDSEFTSQNDLNLHLVKTRH